MIAKSIDFTTALVIEKEIFLEIIKNYPLDFERFCHIKDSINIYNDTFGLLLNCYSNFNFLIIIFYNFIII